MAGWPAQHSPPESPGSPSSSPAAPRNSPCNERTSPRAPSCTPRSGRLPTPRHCSAFTRSRCLRGHRGRRLPHQHPAAMARRGGRGQRGGARGQRRLPRHQLRPRLAAVSALDAARQPVPAAPRLAPARPHHPGPSRHQRLITRQPTSPHQASRDPPPGWPARRPESEICPRPPQIPDQPLAADRSTRGRPDRGGGQADVSSCTEISCSGRCGHA